MDGYGNRVWYVRASDRVKITNWAAAVTNGAAAYGINVIVQDTTLGPTPVLRSYLWAKSGSAVTDARLAAAQAAQDSGPVPAELATTATKVTATVGAGGGGGSVTVGTTSGTVAAGNDSRIVGAAQTAANLSDLTDAAAARAALGLGTAAVLSPAQLAANAALTSAFATAAQINGLVAMQLAAWVYGGAWRFVGVTRDTNGAAVAGTLVWPNGATGVYVTLTASTTYPGKVDSYVVTHTLSGTTTYVTQPTVTRDGNGNIIAQPALVQSSTGLIDLFDRANATNGLGTATTGGAWSYLGSGTWGITGNEAYVPAPLLAHGYAVQSTGLADVQMYVRITALDTTKAQGLVFRVTNATDGYLVAFTDGGNKISLFKNGSFTLLASNTTLPAVGDIMGVRAVGSSITVTVNGVTVITATDSTYLTGTKQGLWVYNGTGDQTTRRWDNVVVLGA